MIFTIRFSFVTLGSVAFTVLQGKTQKDYGHRRL